MFGRHTNNRHSTSSRRLKLESLEQRAMLAGDVMVELDKSGDVLIAGDGADNDFVVETADPTTRTSLGGGSSYIIRGRNDTNIIFDGKSADQHTVFPEVGRDIIIDAGGGDDVVRVNDVEVVRSLRVLLRNGDDQFTMNQSLVSRNFSVHGGGGDDDIRLEVSVLPGGTSIVGGSSVIGGSNASGGMGNDEFELIGFRPGDVINVNGGEGDDSIDMRNLQGETSDVFIDFGNGNDVLDSRSTNVASLAVSGGLGDDEWQETDSVYRGTVNVDLGDGQDGVTLLNSEFQAGLNVQMGLNTVNVVELIDVRESSVAGNAEFRGAMGDQTLSALDSDFQGRLDAFFGGGDDTVGITNSTVNVAVTRLGSGADSIILNGNSFSGGVLFGMGSGSDELASFSTTTFAAPLTIDGGNGQDSATLGQTALSGATIRDFELVMLAPTPDETA